MAAKRSSTGRPPSSAAGAVLAALCVALCLPAVARAQAVAARSFCIRPERASACRSFLLTEGVAAGRVAGQNSVIHDSARAWDPSQPYSGAPIHVRDLPEYIGANVGVLRNVGSRFAFGVEAHLSTVLPFDSEGSADFMVRKAIALRERTWLTPTSYLDASVGFVATELDRLIHPSGPVSATGITTSLVYGTRRLAAFATYDAVTGANRSASALHCGVRVTGLWGAGVGGLFAALAAVVPNIPINMQ